MTFSRKRVMRRRIARKKRTPLKSLQRKAQVRKLNANLSFSDDRECQTLLSIHPSSYRIAASPLQLHCTAGVLFLQFRPCLLAIPQHRLSKTTPIATHLTRTSTKSASRGLRINMWQTQMGLPGLFVQSVQACEPPSPFRMILLQAALPRHLQWNLNTV